ncbi:MAG: hypothetical protein ACLPX8_24170 [Bryobacteraceae bacterium]|jgi:hypothetical protein
MFDRSKLTGDAAPTPVAGGLAAAPDADSKNWMIYHPTKGHRVVTKDSPEHKAHLGDGWQDDPIPPAPEPAPDEDRIGALESLNIEAELMALHAIGDALAGRIAALETKRK